MSVNTIGYIYLDEDDVIELHEDQLKAHGGQSGIRDHGGLASAVAQPQATYGGEDLYPDVFSKAAILAFCIAENQVFVDGNKRAALVSALTFMAVNGYEVPPNENRLYDAMIAIAKKEMTKDDLADLFRALVCEHRGSSS